MTREEAETLFREAEILYRDRRYSEAHDVLRQLDDAYPETRNVLYPLAKCLRRMGRFQEASNICDTLVRKFSDKRAGYMRKQLKEAIDRSNAKTIQVIQRVQAVVDEEPDDVFGALEGVHLTGPPAPAERGPQSLGRYIVAGVLVGIVLVGTLAAVVILIR